MRPTSLDDKTSRGAEDLAGCRAVVMGLGLHGGGVGVAQYLVAQGAEVTVTDLRDEETLCPSLTELEGLPLRYVLGRHEDRGLSARRPGGAQSRRAAGIAILGRGTGGRGPYRDGEQSLYRRLSECVRCGNYGHEGQDYHHGAAFPDAGRRRTSRRYGREFARFDAEPAGEDYGGNARGAGAFELATGSLRAACVQSAAGRGN